MLFILGGKQIVKQSSACYHYFWIHPLVVTITLNFCMLSLHNLTVFFSYACQILYTVMLNMQRKREEFCAVIQCNADIAPWWVQWQTLPTPLQIVIQRKISILRRIRTPLTTPIYPPRCLLYLGMMMLVISCICCLAVPTFDIIHVICLVSTCSVMPPVQFLYHIWELCSLMSFNQP